jgi:hypothetical protein
VNRGGPRTYTGVNPHTDHVHVAWTRAGSQKTSFPRFVLHLAELRTGLEDLAAVGTNHG